MMTRAESIAAQKRILGNHFSGPRTCDCCAQHKARKDGVEQPGRDPLHRGPWHCADCVAKHKTN